MTKKQRYLLIFSLVDTLIILVCVFSYLRFAEFGSMAVVLAGGTELSFVDRLLFPVFDTILN